MKMLIALCILWKENTFPIPYEQFMYIYAKNCVNVLIILQCSRGYIVIS